MGRDYDPVPGQWYENAEEEETFQVLNIDEDSELIELRYENGEVEEIDMETWMEMDLEITDEPEGWSDDDDDDDDDYEDDEDEDDWDEDEEDDWDDDDEEDHY